MAIGSVNDVAKATSELDQFSVVVVDHSPYVVEEVRRYQGYWVISLLPSVGGEVWHLEVASEDVDEPMWETR